MVRMDGTLECEWCSSDAQWGVDTARGHRDVCQRHYDDIVRERESSRFDDLPVDALDMLRQYLGMVA